MACASDASIRSLDIADGQGWAVVASSLLDNSLALNLEVVSHPVVTRALVAELLAMLTEHEPIDLYVVAVGEHGLIKQFEVANR